jgi:hypothetical protein
VTLTLPDLLAGVRAHATPGHRASGAWLRAVPGEHLLEIVALDRAASEGGVREGTDLTRVMVALLKAERGTPAPIDSIAQGIQYTQTLAPAAALEVLRRQGRVTVEPPLPSIFNPGTSIVEWVPVSHRKEPA